MSATTLYMPASTQGIKLAGLIDHTNLKPEATAADIERLCKEALHYKFKAVCVNPCRALLAASILKATGVELAVVTGFPLGANSTLQKTRETVEAVTCGATEIDTVLNIGYLKDKRYKDAKDDIYCIVMAANGKTVKVIIETCLLSNEEKVTACKIAKEAGAHFVKTSTGFSISGASEADVHLMRQTVGWDTGVKASGGIKSLDIALRMTAAGASRLGTSASVKIVTEE